MNNNQLQIKNDFSFDEPEHVLDCLKSVLAPIVTNIYDVLSKSGHFSNDQSEDIVKQFHNEIQQVEVTERDQFDIISMTVLIDQLMEKAVQYETYRFRHNRFLAFFNELLNHYYPALKREAQKATLPFYEWYTAFLFKQINLSQQGSPYEKLTATWLLCEEQENILLKHAEKLLNGKDHIFYTKLASLLFLQANDGARSLALLKGLGSTLHHSDLIDHFFIMEQKDDFIMMKHWFELFFPFEKPKQGTALGKLYEEMLIETGTDKEKISVVWNNWLDQPSFMTYQSRMKRSSKKEKEKILNFIIPKLQEDLYRTQTEATYYQIIAEEELFKEGINSLLIQKKDVSIFSPEIEKLLSIIMKKQPQLLLPFYHQVVERLVQKKSRVHYEEAVYYIKQLQSIYEKMNKHQVFIAYTKGLKQRFKTFRAFIQELKKIDQ